MVNKVLIDRSVVEQALKLLDALSCDENYDYDGCFQHWTDYARPEKLALQFRAALEQQQVEAATGKDYLQVPAGFVLLQTENGKPVYSACLDGGRFHGWLMWKHPDGQWVSKRKLEAWEIMQAEDQRDYGIVQGD